MRFEQEIINYKNRLSQLENELADKDG